MWHFNDNTFASITSSQDQEMAIQLSNFIIAACVFLYLHHHFLINQDLVCLKLLHNVNVAFALENYRTN